MTSSNKALYSHSAEKNLVIAFLSLDDAILEAQADISPAEFFYTPYRNIASICYDLFNGGKQVDIVSIENELKKRNQFEELSAEDDIWLLKNEVAQGTIENNGKIVRTYYKRRTTLQILQKGMSEVYNEGIEVDNLLATVQTKLMDIDIQAVNETKTLGETRMATLNQAKEIKEARLNGDKSAIVPTGLKSLDKIISGFKKDEFIIIAARPGMGKTAVVISIMATIAKQGYKGILFSLEMGENQLTARFLSHESHSTFYQKIQGGYLSKEEEVELLTAGTDIEQNIFMDCTARMSIEKLRAKAIKLKIKEEIDYIIVDYIQLMSSDSMKANANREQEISMISRSLKLLAKELNIPVIGLCQLSRAVETRGGDKRPMLSDLRESGSLEQDADAVIFLYRPEYYGITTYEDGSSSLGVTEAIVAKNRTGGLDTAKINSQYLPQSKFIDFEDGRFDSPNNVF